MEEDAARPVGVKIDKETAIPAGLDYFIDITMSQRFKRLMPIVYNTIENGNLIIRSGNKVWTGVRQHIGNTEFDTDACQLVGHIRNPKGVFQSTDCFKEYFPWLQARIAENGGAIPYNIINAQP